MKIFKKAKENLFLLLILLAYIVMFIVKPDMGITSIKNSGYYIKEMLMIMPVIFILTALLDMWIPKEKITKYLGEESKSKGVILSFVLGSISAGPIYAAFPFCILLLKKGASIRNIIIILSSWAVIKVPMLINEVKFLGFKFMVIRWVLTVIAIIIFSWITSKIVIKKDIPLKEEKKSGLSLNSDACMGCALCTKHYPELFEMKNKKAFIKIYEGTLDMEKLKHTITSCPVNSIDYSEDNNII
ncbi:permease [Clostridium sp.]|uniref:permease n=1 Tax=Clostridium sp. TaxID=1506 RepID=UPI00261E87B4|nr:permease [Clostridium sp.]